MSRWNSEQQRASSSAGLCAISRPSCITNTSSKRPSKLSRCIEEITQASLKAANQFA